MANKKTYYRGPSNQTPMEVWVIAEHWVIEGYLGGMQLGELPGYDMNSVVVTARYTQEDLDELFEEYKREHGHYPDC